VTISPTLDAPPADVLREHVPEVAARLEAVLASCEAAQTAHARWRAALGVRRTYSDDVTGSALREARAADLDALRRGERPTHYAEVVASAPQREGEYHACQAYSDELVSEWNRAGHEAVTPETRKRLAEQRDAAGAACVDAAQRALAAAATPKDDAGRLRAAMVPLAELDTAAERWRLLGAVLGWATWTRPIRHGSAWDPHYFADAYPGEFISSDPVVRARALADPRIRRQLEMGHILPTSEAAARERRMRARV
jgi:hypothetical protein